MEKLSERELVAIIRAHRRESLGAEDGDLSNQRATALDHYHGRPYGNEMEGRSQIVTKDLAETVDWAMPAIMRVFTQSGNIAEFDPVGPEDEELAQQESDYTNQVIMRDNNGFLILHDVIKDALLLKNGYVKHYWENSEKISEEEYKGLSLEQITSLFSELESEGAEVKIKGQDERVEIIQGQPVPLFDIQLQITRKIGKVCIDAVPTEEVRVSKRCRGSVQETPFIEHVTRKTRSDLIEMGMEKEFVYSLPAYDEKENDTQVRARDSVDDESDSLGATFNDKSMDEVEYCEAYLRVDWDGDGIAELRKVVTVADKIPHGKYWNEAIDAVPITGFVAKRMSHRHVGESLDDDLSDLQEIKTVLTRQLLDNIYLTNNNQYAVNERVNLSDFLQSLPGGVKRISGLEPVSGAYEPIMSTPIVNQILPVMDYFEGVKEARTGINKATTGLDPDILKQSTKGAFMENLNRASQKIEMITRMLAETGVKEMVLQVHSLLMKHQDKARITKLRGKYVEVSPQEWRDRTDLTVRVGLGTGNEDEKREKLLMLAGLQEKIAQIGLVGPKQAYAMFSDITEAIGFQMTEKYAIDPESPEFQQNAQGQNKVNPIVEAEQVKAQATLQREQMQNDLRYAIEAMKLQQQSSMEQMQMRLEMMDKEADRRSREAIEAAKLEIQAMLQMREIDLGMPGIGAGLNEQ